MTLNPRPYIKVNMCYELEKETVCVRLERDQAQKLKHTVDEKGGTVWWFTPIEC